MTYLDIDGWFDFESIYLDAVRDYALSPSVFVEIGSWKGKSTVFMAEALKEKSLNHVTFYAVDTFKGSEEHKDEVAKTGGDIFSLFYSNLKACAVEDWVFPIQRSSVAAARFFKPRSVDFIFIDGDHSYAGVSADLEAWFPSLSPNGTLAGHDWYWGEVNLAVRQFARANALKIEVVGTSWRIRQS